MWYFLLTVAVSHAQPNFQDHKTQLLHVHSRKVHENGGGRSGKVRSALLQAGTNEDAPARRRSTLFAGDFQGRQTQFRYNPAMDEGKRRASISRVSTTSSHDRDSITFGLSMEELTSVQPSLDFLYGREVIADESNRARLEFLLKA